MQTGEVVFSLASWTIKREQDKLHSENPALGRQARVEQAVFIACESASA